MLSLTIDIWTKILLWPFLMKPRLGNPEVNRWDSSLSLGTILCLELEVWVGAKNSLHSRQFILTAYYSWQYLLSKYAPKSPQPPDLACEHFLAWSWKWRCEPKDPKMKVSPFLKVLLTNPNNTFLSIDALKSMAGPADLAWDIFELGARFEGGI